MANSYFIWVSEKPVFLNLWIQFSSYCSFRQIRPFCFWFRSDNQKIKVSKSYLVYNTLIEKKCCRESKFLFLKFQDIKICVKYKSKWIQNQRHRTAVINSENEVVQLCVRSFYFDLSIFCWKSKSREKRILEIRKICAL